ncbi:MAG: hypothetical protein QOE61_2170 [Micromonosporaceae bacterium]|jgi:hypothetical protein|nr:hypothetical protein [Micromonosporaceae bacterium]
MASASAAAATEPGVHPQSSVLCRVNRGGAWERAVVGGLYDGPYERLAVRVKVAEVAPPQLRRVRAQARVAAAGPRPASPYLGLA